MIGKALRKIGLLLNPPKNGDVYYGDILYFVLGNNIEFVLHGLTDKTGKLMYSPIPSEDCYRLTVIDYLSETDQIVCHSEVFCKMVPEHPNDVGNWRPRTQPRRISQVYFKNLIVNGLLTKEKT